MEAPSRHPRGKGLICYAQDCPIFRASDVVADNDNALSLSESPGAIFTEISQRRRCYVTATVDPAVHITNASHCGRVTCFIQATSRRQQQQCSSCYYSPASVTQDRSEPCPTHTATSSTKQSCSAFLSKCPSNTITRDNWLHKFPSVYPKTK